MAEYDIYYCRVNNIQFVTIQHSMKQTGNFQIAPEIRQFKAKNVSLCV